MYNFSAKKSVSKNLFAPFGWTRLLDRTAAADSWQQQLQPTAAKTSHQVVTPFHKKRNLQTICKKEANCSRHLHLHYWQHFLEPKYHVFVLSFLNI